MLDPGLEALHVLGHGEGLLGPGLVHAGCSAGHVVHPLARRAGHESRDDAHLPRTAASLAAVDPEEPSGAGSNVRLRGLRPDVGFELLYVLSVGSDAVARHEVQAPVSGHLLALVDHLAVRSNDPALVQLGRLGLRQEHTAGPGGVLDGVGLSPTRPLVNRHPVQFMVPQPPCVGVLLRSADVRTEVHVHAVRQTEAARVLVHPVVELEVVAGDCDEHLAHLGAAQLAALQPREDEAKEGRVLVDHDRPIKDLIVGRDHIDRVGQFEQRCLGLLGAGQQFPGAVGHLGEGPLFGGEAGGQLARHG